MNVANFCIWQRAPSRSRPYRSLQVHRPIRRGLSVGSFHTRPAVARIQLRA